MLFNLPQCLLVWNLPFPSKSCYPWSKSLPWPTISIIGLRHRTFSEVVPLDSPVRGDQKRVPYWGLAPPPPSHTRTLYIQVPYQALGPLVRSRRSRLELVWCVIAICQRAIECFVLDLRSFRDRWRIFAVYFLRFELVASREIIAAWKFALSTTWKALIHAVNGLMIWFWWIWWALALNLFNYLNVGSVMLL